MSSLILCSPAKINLCLEVWRRRDDGYHEITTLMQMVDLADVVRLERRDAGITLTAEGLPVPAGVANLAFRAAERFLAGTGQGGAHTPLMKRFPVGGGRGGGSS